MAAEHKIGDDVIVTLGQGQIGVGKVSGIRTEMTDNSRELAGQCIREYIEYRVVMLGARDEDPDKWLPFTAVHKDLSQISWIKPFIPKGN